MIVKDNIAPDKLPDHLADQFSALITAHQYDQIAHLLEEAQQASLSAENRVTADLLAAACHICLTAAQVYAEVEFHQTAIEESQAHLAQLKQQLYSVLEITSDSIRYENAIPPKRVTFPVPSPATERRSWKNLLGFIRRDDTAYPDTSHLKTMPPLVPNPNMTKSDPVDSGFMVYCLGTFEIYRNDIRLLENGYSRKGLLIFKYLLLNRGHPIRKEVLMELLWPDSDEQAQRNNLNVAIYSLRQMFHNGGADLSYILFQNDCYCFNPEMEIWADFEAFLKHYQAAQRLEAQHDLPAAIQEYQTAEMLYQGEFLPDDLYDEWLEPQRQLLRTAYLSTLSRLSSYYFEAGDYAPCISILNKTLEIDACHEEAHCCLMRCYSRQKQPYLAQRQYDLCVKSLAAELAVDPLPETTALYQRIRAGEVV